MVLKDCSTCLVYGAEEQLLMKARVVSADEHITLHFDDIQIFGPETETVLWVDFFDSQLGCIKTMSKLTMYKNDNPDILEPWAADCTVMKVTETLQRQKDLRVRLEKELIFSSAIHGRFKGLVANISVGGLLLHTKTELRVHEQISFSHCFLKREHDIRAIILREQPKYKDYNVYGCQFLQLTNSAEKDIRQFVFRQQLRKTN